MWWNCQSAHKLLALHKHKIVNHKLVSIIQINFEIQELSERKPLHKFHYDTFSVILFWCGAWKLKLKAISVSFQLALFCTEWMRNDGKCFAPLPNAIYVKWFLSCKLWIVCIVSMCIKQQWDKTKWKGAKKYLQKSSSMLKVKKKNATIVVIVLFLSRRLNECHHNGIVSGFVKFEYLIRKICWLLSIDAVQIFLVAFSHSHSHEWIYVSQFVKCTFRLD